MTSFAEFFGLADAKRTTFVLSPERDASRLVDMDGLLTFLQERVRPGATAPQAVLRGEFGTGKTHALRYVERVLAPEHHLKPVYVMLSNFGAKSTFSDAHVQFMSVLNDPLQAMLREGRGVDRAIKDSRKLSGDAQLALQLLRDPGTSINDRATARTWLMGVGPTPTQARKLGLTGRLFETAGPVQLVNLWKGVSELWGAVSQQRLLLLLDEGEAFSRVTDVQAQASLGSGLRELFDPDNNAIGVFLAVNTPDVRVGVHPVKRADFESRISGKELALKGLADPDQVERFIRGWWQQIGLPDSRLLDEGAVRIVARRLKELRDLLAVRPETASMPTQRNLMNVLAFIGKRAMDEGRRPPITEIDVRSWFALKS